MKTSPQSWREMKLAPRVYAGVVIACGSVVLAYTILHGSCHDPLKFSCYLAVALAASRLKVTLPGITGTMSVNFLFPASGHHGTQCRRDDGAGVRRGRSAVPGERSSQSAAYCVQPVLHRIGDWGNVLRLQLLAIHHVIDNPSALLFMAACVYFIANTLPVAIIITLTEGRSLRKIWADCYFWSFPYYLVGAGVVGVMSWLHNFTDWQTSLLTLPVAYLIYRSYRLYLGKLADEKRHVEEIADLHLRTIEALALAIEAKDQTTHDHLQRVRIYASEIAKELKVTPEEMEALQAAALLHDIGKLAIPEHIVSKPGRLTPEEFEKMKIHPVVGAEILERVRFPYPVVPIVAAHHEKFDGTGYPLGLKGTEIPIGARILAAVDFLDALASDRQYRRALPMDGAMARLMEESGKAFDPEVVNALRRKYTQLEILVHARMEALNKKSADEGIEEKEAVADRRQSADPWRRTSRRICEARKASAGAQLPEFDRGRAAGSANPLRTEPGPGRLPQPERNALGVFGEIAAVHSLRCDRDLCVPRRRTGTGVRERRQLPTVRLAENSDWTGPLRLGRAKPEADFERKSVRGTGLSQRPSESTARSPLRWRCRWRACKAWLAWSLSITPRKTSSRPITCGYCWRSAPRWRWRSRTR